MAAQMAENPATKLELTGVRSSHKRTEIFCLHFGSFPVHCKNEFLFLCLPLPSDVVFVQCALPKGADCGREELRVLRGPGFHRYLDEQFQATKAENQFASGIIFGAL